MPISQQAYNVYRKLSIELSVNGNFTLYVRGVDNFFEVGGLAV